MMILYVLLLFNYYISLYSHYTIYYSKISPDSHPTFDCLYAYIDEISKETNKPHVHNYFLIPYCQRLENENERVHYLNNIHENIKQTFTFKDLKEKNITSQQLLEWFAPIDIAESYEMNLNDSDEFHNCSFPWFGFHCQYQFMYNTSLSFTDIVYMNINNTYANITNGTCYPFINSCKSKTWPLCIDWREICNGKIDCLNGEDENYCHELELHECNQNEYRCHYGGQCIPLSFARDNRLSVDCLDGSDEKDYLSFNNLLMAIECGRPTTFRCEERISRYLGSFHCGDGQFLTQSFIPTLQRFCSNNRDIELSRSLLTSMVHIENENCQKAFYCALHFNRTIPRKKSTVIDIDFFSIIDVPSTEECEPLSKYCTSKWIVFPERPILFGSFQFIYFTNRTIDEFKDNITPNLLCFHQQQCPMLISKVKQIEIINGLICFNPVDLFESIEFKDFDDIMFYFDYLNRECLLNGIEKSCLNSTYFYCNQSMKCISYHRVRDGYSDCQYHEDELVDSCLFNDSTRYQCQRTIDICLKPVTIGDDIQHCDSYEDEIFVYTNYLEILISYADICNEIINPILFKLNTNETDETNCYLWPCDNPYTHCNDIINCLNGEDELNCPLKQCSINELQCQNEFNNKSFCLLIDQIYEKYLDKIDFYYIEREIYFSNRTLFNNNKKEYFSWNNTQCIDFDRNLHSILTKQNKCLYQERSYSLFYQITIKHLDLNETCILGTIPNISPDRNLFNFKTNRLGYLPLLSLNDSLFSSHLNNSIENFNNILRNFTFDSYCHRGIPVLVYSNQIIRCFCPPNYFGIRCQWQNQRISLTIEFIYRVISSNYVVFQAIIMLIDQTDNIITYSEQITYVPIRDCKSKFNVYLLYPQRPKSISKNYSIQIDLFEKIQLKYWTTWIISIPFIFLPVNRISTQLKIPEYEQNFKQNKSSFHCSNTSICACSLYTFGRYCQLKYSICNSSINPCLHDGLCIPHDNRIDLQGFTCFCREYYSGNRCQYENIRIYIEFNQLLIPKSSIFFLHFITSFQTSEHEQMTIIKKVRFNQNSLTIFLSQLFHILFIQREDKLEYYLAIIRENFHLQEKNISTYIQLNQRCLTLNELNQTLLKYKYLQRVKYYPYLCRQYLNLMCFFDGYLMCICDLDRFANCFLFNQTIKNDCQGENHCLNNGQCLQNNQTCPNQFTCICPDCYYGSKCQFSTKNFLFSLDAILGYHIQPNLSIIEQPFIIKISIFISCIILFIGFINGILSFLIFLRKIPRQVGSGNYLLISSIISFLMTLILTIKFWNLILTQQLIINNRILLYFNCITLDFTLKILLTSIEWLNSCVAIERMISVIKTTTFNKKTSRKISKWIIFSILILIFFSYLHDPIHRQLIDDIDIDEIRIWCSVNYSPKIEVYNFFINIFHFLIPFLINILSAIWIIISITRIRTGIQPDQTFQQHFKHQLYQHRHILYAPCLLIILALPRLIISFVTGCMRSSRQPWLYLFAYFISFIPSMLTFIVFVIPSTTYKNEFRAMTQQAIRRLNFFKESL